MKVLTKKELTEELTKQYAIVWGNDTHMHKWAIKQDCIALKFDDGMILTIEKPHIETRFCFGHGFCGVSSQEEENRAYERMEYANTNAQYFIDENTEKFRHCIKTLTDNKDICSSYIYIKPHYYKNSGDLVCWDIVNSWEEERYLKFNSAIRKLTKEEIEMLIDTYKQALEMLMKRLETYLKKYGLSKLHTWTYLRD